MKNRTTKFCFALFLTLVLPWTGTSEQVANFYEETSHMKPEESWTIIEEQDAIRVSAKLTTCGHRNRPVFLLQIQNTSSSSGYQVAYTTNVKNNRTAGPQHYSLSVPAGSSSEGSCSNLDSRSLVTYAVAGLETSLSDLEFQIISINTLSHE
jgi:hypothetical protein